MRTSITRSFRFEASHQLEWHKGKCSRLHGHGYRLEVTIEGDLDSNGVVVDFDEVGRLVDREVIDVLDHSHLNEILENPTAENIARWSFDRLDATLDGVARIRLFETADCWAEIVR